MSRNSLMRLIFLFFAASLGRDNPFCASTDPVHSSRRGCVTLINRRTAFTPSAAAVLIALVLCLVAPATAAAQWAPAKPALVTLETPSPSSPAPGEDSSAPLEFADAPSADDPPLRRDLPSSLHDRLLQPEKKPLGERIVPYALVGMVVGGLVGYAVHESGAGERDEKSCRERDTPGCELIPYYYVAIGGGLGLGAGTLVGYIRERRR